MMRCKKVLALILVVLALLTACSGPEEKKMRFYGKARAFSEKGDLVKASLELKNAIQIDPKFADAHYLLGQVELRRGNPGSAFAEFGKTVELNPGDLDAQAQLGKLLLMKGEPELARAKADLVLKSDPRHVDGQLLRAGILLNAMKWSEGATRLAEVGADGVTRPEVYLMLAAARNGLKDPAGAERALQDGAGKNPSSLELQRALADLYAASGRVDDAAGRIKRIMELDPANQTYTITLAGLYWDHRREGEARELLARLSATHAGDEELLTTVAAFYLSRRRPDEAEKLLKDSIRANPATFRLRFALSEIYIGSGRSAEGIALLKECLSLEKDPGKPLAVQARNLLARAHFLRDEPEQAERYVTEVLKESPNNLEATYLKGRLELKRGNGAAAITAFRSVVNDRPREMEGYLLLADAHMINQEPHLALEKLQQTDRLEPGSLAVERAFARYYVSQKDISQGLQRMERFVAAHGNDLEARLELADLYRLSGEPRKAEAGYHQIKSRVPRFVPVYLRLAELFNRQGEKGRAMAELAAARKAAPDDPQPALMLAGMKAAAGNPAAAKGIYEELLARTPHSWLVLNEYASFLGDYGSGRDDLARAHTMAKEASAQRPNDPALQDTLGWAEFRMGNADKAVPLLEKAATGLPANPQVSYHAGMAMLKAGRTNQARQLLARAVQGGEFPGSREAREALQGL